MNSFSHKLRSVFLLSIALSLAIHLLTFKVLTFQFTLIPEPLKPNLTFLGPILYGREFQAQGDGTNKSSETLQLDHRQDPKNSSPMQMPKLEKPMNVKPSAKDKTSLKSTFDIQLKEDASEQGESTSIGIDLKPVPYKPLSIQPNDKD